MKNRNIEKMIYEYLGVNLFRKYVLFNYEKIWKLIPVENLIGYRLDGFNIGCIKKYKFLSKWFGFVHFLSLPILFFKLLTEPVDTFAALFCILLDCYCIMV